MGIHNMIPVEDFQKVDVQLLMALIDQTTGGWYTWDRFMQLDI